MEDQSKIVTIIGAGRWGKALGELARRNDYGVRLWSRNHSESLESILQGTDVIVSAVSMAGVQSVIDQLQPLNLSEKTILVTATKGLDLVTMQTPSQLWKKAFPYFPLVVLSGPNLSKEITMGLPAATAVASKHTLAAERVQTIFSSPTFRVYLNRDPLGTELGGTLKNVVAIAAGVCDGLALGTNAKSALLTRALPEMIRVGLALGAQPETFFGLSGLGDLLATCSSPLSRNYQVGYKLGKGITLEKILAESEGYPEGVNTTEVLVKIAQIKDISVPIADQVYHLLKGEITPQEAVKNLMERHLTSEFSDLFN
jgi:glycerol-3-phosphate dehydrogenase (NAD(P)+)